MLIQRRMELKNFFCIMALKGEEVFQSHMGLRVGSGAAECAKDRSSCIPSCIAL